MRRRSLRIDPELDLSAHLFDSDDLPERCDPAVFFGRDAPLEIEVGSGKGLFMRTACESQPDRNFLGIEVSRKYARLSAARLAKRELANGKMICGDALQLFREWLPAECAEAVHVYFPDPWWKARHKKRRVMTTGFVTDIERVLSPGGRLHFWTDVQEYFETTLELIADCSSLKGQLPVGERAAEHDLDYRTHFERRMRLHGEAVYRSEFVKA